MRVRYSTEKNGKPVKKAIVYTQDEHGINFSDVDPEAVHIIATLRNRGYETYIVGGAVRDLILGKKPKDFDIVSEAIPTRIKKLFRNARIIGHRFRLVHVCFGHKTFEVSTFRSLKDGLTSNTFGTIEEDVLRRDFTLNALFYDPLTQTVVDYVGGMRDIQKKTIRPIISMDQIFQDDPVRMLRAVKYAAATGFKLPLFLKWKIKKQSPLLGGISPSRLTEEIFKIIHSSAILPIVENLESFGLYAYLQPRASQLIKEGGGFRERYLQSLGALSQEGFKGLPGEAMAGLIRDYLEDTAQWDESPEGYKNTFIAARQFVLPMNPPRVELDRAIRLLFKEHGIILKRYRFLDRERIPLFPKEEPLEAQKSRDFPAEPEGRSKPKKHRSSRRRKPLREREVPSKGNHTQQED